MLSITIDGKPAFLNSGTSFEFVKENNFFDSSDGFSFDMEFHLKGCAENRAVFGNIMLPYLHKPTDLLPCTIQCGKLFLQGSVAIMEVTDEHVKCQFLQDVDAGESEELLLNTYINELDLGSYPQTDPSKVAPDGLSFNNYYYYPWTTSDAEVVNNKRAYKLGTKYQFDWDEETNYITYQPSLWVIVLNVLEAIGYEIEILDFLARIGKLVRAIICNALPPSWNMPEFKDALPHWNVIEFFEKLGYFYGGVFTFDHFNKKIKFQTYSEIKESAGTVYINKVLSEYSTSISRDEKDAGYIPMKRVRYKDSDENIWKWWCCPAFLKNIIEKYPDTIKYYDSWDAALSNIRYFMPYNRWLSNRGNFAGSVIYIKDIDTYFLMRVNYAPSAAWGFKDTSNVVYKNEVFAQMTPLNIFGPPVDSYDEEASYDELDIVPVIVDWTDNGQVMILPVGISEESEDEILKKGELSGMFLPSADPDIVTWSTNNLEFNQSRLGQKLEKDRKDSSAYYDRLFIGFEESALCEYQMALSQAVAPPDINIWFAKMSAVNAGLMRLDRKGNGIVGAEKIDPKVMYSFSFLGDEIPDIHAVFNINGVRFVCSKLTATFMQSGMSKIIKGDFYRIIDTSL